MDANLAGESHPGGRPSKTRVLQRQNQFRRPPQGFEDPTSPRGTGNTMQDEVISAGSDIYADELGPTDEGNNLRKSRVYAGSEGTVNEHSPSITNGSSTSEPVRSAATTYSNLPTESHPAERSRAPVLGRLNQFRRPPQGFEDPTSPRGTGNTMQDEVISAGSDIYADELGPTDEGNNLRKSRVYAGSEGTVNEHSTSITNGSSTSEPVRSAATTYSNLPTESHPAERSRAPVLRRLNQLGGESWDCKDQTQFSQGAGDIMQHEVNTAGTGDIMQEEVNTAGSDISADEFGSPIQGNNLRKLRVGGPQRTVDKPSISITNGSPSSETMRASTSCSHNTGGLTMGSAATTHCEKTADCRSKSCCSKCLSLFGLKSSAKRISPTEDLPSTSKEGSENSTTGSAITIGGKTHRPTNRSSATVHGDKAANHISKATSAQGIKESSSSVRRSGIPDQLSTSLISTFEDPVNMGKVFNRNNGSSESPSGEQDDLPADDRVAHAITGLTSGSKAIQMEAAMALRFFAKVDPENRVKIAEADGIRPLIALISSDDPELQEQSVTAILNLSLNDENKSRIADLHGIKPLIEALNGGRADTKANAACALLNLSKIKKNNISIGRSGAIPLLVSLLEDENFHVKDDALAALFSLCSIEKNGKKAVEAGIVKPLVGLMVDFESDMPLKSAHVLSLLLPLADARKALKEQGAVRVLVKILEVGKEGEKEIAMTILLQLCESEFGLGYGHLVANEGARPLLVDLMQSGTSLAKQKAEALTKLLPDPEHRRQLDRS